MRRLTLPEILHVALDPDFSVKVVLGVIGEKLNFRDLDAKAEQLSGFRVVLLVVPSTFFFPRNFFCLRFK